MSRFHFAAVFAFFLAACGLALAAPAPEPAAPTSGRLEVLGEDGQPKGACPLKHTDVQVNIAGFIARVTVTQQFQNPFDHKIEAIYIFPLHQDSAVDAMTMKVGERLVRGVIKERGEAQQIYQEAKAAGHVASLLDQERPNIFTQSVANIEPGEAVEITITYSQTLEWEDGRYQFDFPMVVGPRYIPGGSAAPPRPLGKDVIRQSDPRQPIPQATDQVPDAPRISPPVTPEGTRAGHDISLSMQIDSGGLPIQDIRSEQHEIRTAIGENTPDKAVVSLVNNATIPNRDFVLSYRTAGESISDAVLTHTDERGRFFTLILQPPARVQPAQIVPREVIFVIDSSGSMQGFPIETAKKAMKLCIEDLQPNDTFNLLTFSGHTSFCFPGPVANTPANKAKAQEFLASLQGRGGTEMMKAIEAALADQHDDEKLRIVCFMTDGYVGNDMAIIDAVKKHAGSARVFSFGIGSSVNRYLLDGMAAAGRGEVHYVYGQDETEAEAAAKKFYQRINAPVLTDITLDFAGLPVEEVYPTSMPDLFSVKPLLIRGRYTQGGRGAITLRGRSGGGEFERKIDVMLPGSEPGNAVLASQWARAKVDHLMAQDLLGIQQGQPNDATKQQIIALGIAYDLMTQFTSFVAVEELRITKGGESKTVQVPVEMPQGVSYEGVFGQRGERDMAFGSIMSLRGGVPASTSGPHPSRPQAQQLTRRLAEKPAERTQYFKEVSDFKQIAADETLTDEQKREQLLPLKLDAKLAERLAKFRENKQGGDDKLEVKLTLRDLDAATLAKLKELGFEQLAATRAAKMLLGTIPLKSLEKLALLSEVLRVEMME